MFASGTNRHAVGVPDMDEIAEQTISWLRVTEVKLVTLLVTLQWSLLRKGSPFNVATKRALNIRHFKDTAFGSAVV
jgi:hypothetical protein